MEHVTDETYGSMVETSDLPVVLDFGATWCGPCKKLEPILEKISTSYTDKVRFAKVDIEQAPEVARKFGVMSVPTVVFVKGGARVHHFVGLQQEAKITKMIADHFGV